MNPTEEHAPPVSDKAIAKALYLLGIVLFVGSAIIAYLIK